MSVHWCGKNEVDGNVITRGHRILGTHFDIKEQGEPGMQEDVGTLRSLVDLQCRVVEALEPWVDLGLPQSPRGKLFGTARQQALASLCVGCAPQDMQKPWPPLPVSSPGSGG